MRIALTGNPNSGKTTETITVVSHIKSGCVVSIKDARYTIDNQLADAIVI